jgi:hypothetical protein
MGVRDVMWCPVCNGEDFVVIEYVTTHGVRAPAFRCVRCEAIHLDEAAARTEEERESVRLAKAQRASASAQFAATPVEPLDEEVTSPGCAS